MVHALERQLDLSYDQLISEFKEVYRVQDSLEFSFSIQQLASVRGRSQSDIDELVRSGRGAFKRVSRKHLKAYSGVEATLAWLQRQGHQVICVTNSPAYLAQKRLFDLRIDQYVDQLVAWEGIALTEADKGGYLATNLLRNRSRIRKVTTFKRSSLKPNPTPFLLAIESCKIRPSDAWTIGDSISKDLAPASELGIKTIWAKYGATFNPESKNSRTLLSITNWSDEEIRATHGSVEYKPDFVIDTFSDIRQILPESQPDLFSPKGDR